MGQIKVKLGDRSYPILVSTGKWESELSRRVKSAVQPDGKVFVVTDANIYSLFGAHLAAAVHQTGRRAVDLTLPAGEKTKSKRYLNDVYTYLLDHKVTRQDLIVAAGGGVLTDLAGYAAATVLRGIKWGAVSTTLLGMVDAAIGGKTGINHPRGKNLIGAFWQPSFVICDTDFLQTLNVRQLIAGLGEVVKYAGLAGDEFINEAERYLAAGDLLNERRLKKLIGMSAAYKADIVSRDEREGKLRMLLNLGHTFGHGIEQSLGYGRLLHGEAVLIGLLGAIELSCLLKPSRTGHLHSYRELVLQLVSSLPKRKISADKVIEAMAWDKKRSEKTLRFVLIDRPGHPFITQDVSQQAVREAVTAMLEHYKAKGVRHAKGPDRKRT